MTSNISVRRYRPRQQVFAKAKSRRPNRLALHLPVEQVKMLGVMVAAALVLGLGLTQFFHGRMADMQAGAEQLRARNTAIATENIRLLAARAQVASKTQVAALAKNKLQLFEPDQGQVRRM